MEEEKFYLIDTNLEETEWTLKKEFATENDLNLYMITHRPTGYILDEFEYERLKTGKVNLVDLIDEICGGVE